MPHARAPRLFLIRHGETAWSRTGQHTGLTDIPLTTAGEVRAATLRPRLAGESFARVFVSPLVRARRTCELAGFGDRAEVDADLVEWDYGQYDGITSSDIHARWPDWDLFRDGPPGGETPDAVIARAARFVEKARAVTRDSDGDIAAFSHGHFIRMLAAAWLDLPPAAAKRFYTATASVSVLGYEHGHADPVILLWNDTRA